MTGRYIDRAEVFNRLASINTDDNAYRTNVYQVVQEAEGYDVYRHGEWSGTHIVNEYGVSILFMECSVCRQEAIIRINSFPFRFGVKIENKYCPNCGARMDGEL